MQFAELKQKIPEKLFSELEKISEMRPCQQKAIASGLLEGRSLLVCSPTGSGKTLVAEIAAVKNILENKGKCVYIVPLKSLATEKFAEFKEKYEKLGIKVAISIGDLDSQDPWLAEKDLIITVSEKLDSLLRHGAPWISQVATVVIDEIHLLNDPGRGPTLEILTTMLKKILKNSQFIALSATIGNPKELAEWLGAELVEDSWRPVKLYEGVFDSQEIDFFDGKENLAVAERHPDQTVQLAINTLNQNKQALVFCATKQSAESMAEKISKSSTNTKQIELAKKVLHALPQPTVQCRKLAKFVLRGIAFHHAGIVQKQKSLVEDSFRNGAVKIICCTPTLAAGVNLPAFRAIMKSLKRYSEKWGYSWIPVLEYKQMTGRAGRPGMEEFGEAISIASSEDEAKEIYEKYICGVPEEIDSKLAVEPVLRMAILGLIASGFCRAQESVIKFFADTFYGFSYANDYEIKSKIMKILQKLKDYKFIEQNAEKVYATYLGKRVAELYLDPESAFALINGLKVANAAETQAISYLHLISSVIEIPNLRFRKSDSEFLQEKLIELEPYLLIKPPSEFSWEFEEFQDTFKTALMFEDWISEMSDDALMEKYKIRPGEMRTKLTNADWILYSCQELSRISEFKDLISEIMKLRVRMKHGIKEELLPLKKLKGIGRYKARKLFRNGLTGLQKVKEAKYELLASLIGPRTAARVKGQLGEKVDLTITKLQKEGQLELGDF
ncbi:TPA: DEAD/DEAH box helicase [archaeon]|nr:DEAD/DEAH box helicase [Candidatus Naiadarchaeales archaeon SRR2090153.bin461]